MPAIHDGSGGLAKAIDGSRISAAAIGRDVAIARHMERDGSVGGISCRGHEPERIRSLPMVERPEAKMRGNPKRGRRPGPAAVVFTTRGRRPSAVRATEHR